MVNFASAAFIFPGQGSQAIGMGQDIAAAYPIAKDTFAEADDIIGYKLSQLMFDGPEEQLNETQNTQPAMYVCSVAILRILQAERPGVLPAYTAGHSLGEFTALTAAEALSFADGVQLVKERGRLMQQAGEKNPGGMAALLGIRIEDALQLCEDMGAKSGKVLVIANDNCPGQIVISGDNDALDLAVEQAGHYGARRIVRLPVSVATHSPLMQPAKEVFTQLVKDTEFQTPKIPVYANASAKALTTIESIREELETQLTSTVRWRESVQAMIEAGADTFIEMGSRDVLTGLLRRIDRSKSGMALNNLETLQSFIEANK